MKFSILLPTRNRLDLLKLAVQSVRLQHYEDWEIIISDNASEEDVSGFVASCGDPRIRYFRTEHAIPVTDNWNIVLSHSTGDYFVMLGDDDALMRGCLPSVRSLLDEWGRPDALYTQACQFAYPGVIPGHERGFMQVGYNAFLANADRPFRLPREVALQMVRSAMSFRVHFGFNMQHFFINRSLVEKLRAKGAFFKSPYPDYYAANAVLLSARSIVVNPSPLVMIGISPRSYGFYHFNEREKDAAAFLQNAPPEEMTAELRDVLVPGSYMNDCWLFAMQTLAKNFSGETDLRVDYERYRLLQYYTLLSSRSWRTIPSLWRLMRWDEMVRYGLLGAMCAGTWLLLVPSWRRQAKDAICSSRRPFPPFDSKIVTVPYQNILEAVENYGR